MADLARALQPPRADLGAESRVARLATTLWMQLHTTTVHTTTTAATPTPQRSPERSELHIAVREHATVAVLAPALCPARAKLRPERRIGLRGATSIRAGELLSNVGHLHCATERPEVFFSMREVATVTVLARTFEPTRADLCAEGGVVRSGARTDARATRDACDATQTTPLAHLQSSRPTRCALPWHERFLGRVVVKQRGDGGYVPASSSPKMRSPAAPCAKIQESPY